MDVNTDLNIDQMSKHQKILIILGIILIIPLLSVLITLFLKQNAEVEKVISYPISYSSENNLLKYKSDYLSADLLEGWKIKEYYDESGMYQI